MTENCVEIKVAFIGNVSAGKTTLLNALLKYKFSEMSMKRSTARANYFRIHSATKNKASPSKSRSLVPDNPRSSPTSVLKEITEDNATKIRKGDKVLEKVFDIECDEDIVECRKDTTLVIVDIPGINEAHTDEGYKEYVSDKWTTFDCVVVVMDGKQGVNTQEQVFLLDFVKTNLKIKKVPVIVLCNKIDDGADTEQAELVHEAEKEVKKIFSRILDKNKFAFIPISAVHAYIHQCASTMTIDQLKGFDQDLIEKLGRDLVGRRRWSKMSAREKLQEAYSIVSDPESVQEALRESNFNEFVKTLRNFVGGEATQTKLIEQQLEVERKRFESSFSAEETGIVDNLRNCYDRTKYVLMNEILEQRLKRLRQTFWLVYNKYQLSCYSIFTSDIRKVDILANAMTELIKYFGFLVENKVHDEIPTVLKMAENLVRKVVHFVVGAVNTKDTKVFWSDRWQEAQDLAQWQAGFPGALWPLTPVDFNTILRSMLLMSYNKHFCTKFGKEKVMLETTAMFVFDNYNVSSLHNCPTCNQMLTHLASSSKCNGYVCNNCRKYYLNSFPDTTVCCNNKLDRGTTICPNQYCRFPYKHFVLPDWNSVVRDTYTDCLTQVGLDLRDYMKLVQIHIPQSLKDPKHYGHLIYMFCELMDLSEQLEA